jgi:mRNA interferase MazF
MREIVLAHLDKTRPVVILTRELARPAMRNVTVAPITSTIKGLSTEVPVGKANGLDGDCVIAVDNITTVPASKLDRSVGYLNASQEHMLANAIILAFDLEAPLQ